MKITFDPTKRAKTMELDFAAAAEVFRGVTVGRPDERFDYGEVRRRPWGGSQGEWGSSYGPTATTVGGLYR